MKRQAKKFLGAAAVLLPGLLLGMGCTARDAAKSVPAAQPAQIPLEPPSATTAKPSMNAEATTLANASPPNISGITTAIKGTLAWFGADILIASDSLAPFTFVWPVTPDGAHVPYVAKESTGVGCVITREGDRILVQGRLESANTSGELSLWGMSPTNLHGRNVEPETDLPSRAQVDDSFLRAFAGMEPHEVLTLKVEKNAGYEDVRRHFAERAIENWLFEAAVTRQQIYPTLEALQAATGEAPINLTPVEPKDADLLLEFDGNTAYRIQTRYSGGPIADFAFVLSGVGTPDVAMERVPAERYLIQSAPKFVPMGAWNLVSADKASLPTAK